MTKQRKLQLLMMGVTGIFVLMLFMVTITGYSRKSGSTGLDVVKIHQMRQNAIAGTP